MKHDKAWEAELQEAPLLRSLRDKEAFFQVPETYFGEWEERVSSICASEAEHATLADKKWPKESPFQVPEGYFEQLSDGREHQEDSIIQLPKENVFQTPPGYFDQLSASVAASIEAENEAETTTVRPMWRRPGFVGLAVAAVIACILLIRGIGQQDVVPSGWQDFSEEELLAQVEYMDTDLIMEMISDEELPSLNLGSDFTEEEVEALLEDMDPEELLEMAGEGEGIW